MEHQSPESLVIKALSIGELKDVDLTISPGEIVCLSGESGSGKSRLLRAIADLEVHQGQVCLGECARESMAAHDWRRWVMLVPAESQWWGDTVGEHVCHIKEEDLEALGFSRAVLGWQVSRLSSGEKQRLAAIRALSCQPKALLLDEPTANLDDDNTAKFEAWVLKKAQEQQMPILWVAHDEAQIQRVGHRHFKIRGDHLEVAK